MSTQQTPSYPTMSKKHREFLDYVIRMYAGQENDERFASSDQIVIDLPGLEHFIVKKYVYSPEHVNVALAWPKFIATRTEGKSFLDMGTGTGISAVYVARHGKPSQVAASDISPMAVGNCKANTEQYGLVEPFFRTYLGDVYSAIPTEETFDVMFWNFPWNAPDKTVEEVLAERNLPATPERLIQLRAGLDRQYEGLRKFIDEGRQRLNPGGEILLGAGTPSRHDIIYGEAERLGYNIEVAATQDMIIDKVGNQATKVILYRLTR